MAEVIPWWAKATPAIDAIGMRFADVWDALFGRIETFLKVEHQGSWFICERRDAWEFMGTAADGDTYTLIEVSMTRRQFNNLPDFAGF